MHSIDLNGLPRVVVGLSNADYHAEREFDSRSFLLAVMKGGGESQLWMQMGRSLFTGNSATSTGTEFDAIVTAVLEGTSFDDTVVVPPDDILGANGSRSTKAYKEWAANQTAVCVTADIKAKYGRMLDSMRGCDAVYRLMEQTVKTQVSVFFEAFGHKLKVRPDACTDTEWWDLKTTSSTWDRLHYSVRDYGYAEQAWLYTQGAKQVGYKDFRFPFVFVQTVPPFAVRARYLPQEMVDEAGVQLINVMEEVRLRRSTGMYYPADAGEITEMEIPAWALKTEEVVTL